jgi:hypothetical protein
MRWKRIFFREKRKKENDMKTTRQRVKNKQSEAKGTP